MATLQIDDGVMATVLMTVVVIMRVCVCVHVCVLVCVSVCGRVGVRVCCVCERLLVSCGMAGRQASRKVRKQADNQAGKQTGGQERKQERMKVSRGSRQVHAWAGRQKQPSMNNASWGASKEAIRQERQVAGKEPS